jgi:hypothetical protein
MNIGALFGPLARWTAPSAALRGRLGWLSLLSRGENSRRGWDRGMGVQGSFSRAKGALLQDDSGELVPMSRKGGETLGTLVTPSRSAFFVHPSAEGCKAHDGGGSGARRGVVGWDAKSRFLHSPSLSLRTSVGMTRAGAEVALNSTSTSTATDKSVRSHTSGRRFAPRTAPSASLRAGFSVILSEAGVREAKAGAVEGSLPI